MAITTYNYTRNILTTGTIQGCYDIDNPNRVDGGSLQIRLYSEIKTALPGKSFSEISNGTSCDLIFTNALTGAEKTTLDTVVSDHQNDI